MKIHYEENSIWKMLVFFCCPSQHDQCPNITSMTNNPSNLDDDDDDNGDDDNDDNDNAVTCIAPKSLDAKLRGASR